MPDGREESNLPSSGGPVYQQIKAVLSQELRGQEHPPGTPFITERELCKRFAVSSTTAVRVLNDLAADGLLVRRRGLGTFVAKPSPRSAKRDGSSPVPTIVCILHGLSDSYVSMVLRGAETVCNELGYRLVLVDTKESATNEERALRTALSHATGILLYPVEGRPHPELFEEARQLGVPVVMLDRYRPDVVTDAVIVDNVDVGYRITRQLLELGHRRIATLWSETDCTSVHDRLAGHTRALHEAGLPIQPEFTVLQRYWPTTEERRRSHLQRLFALPEPPTALLCANGYVVAGVAQDLAGVDPKLLHEIDLAGLDSAGPYDLVPLTVVAALLPSEELGRRGALLLHQRIHQEPAPNVERVVLPIEIRTRASSVLHLRPVATSKGSYGGHNSDPSGRA